MSDVTIEQLGQLIERARVGQFSREDLSAFMQDPQRWRQTASGVIVPRHEELHLWMQGVYNDLGIDVQVPGAPKLTDRQLRSLDRFGFRMFFIPAIEEANYPAGFVKPDWTKYLDPKQTERKPLASRWVAIETIPKPHWDDQLGCTPDPLAAALKLQSRFRVSWDDLHGGLLAKVAKLTGFPKKGTRLPTAEEWNFLGNLMNWLRENRKENLPDLGATNSWEWVENGFGSDCRLVVGGRGDGWLGVVRYYWHVYRFDFVAFRVLAVL